MRGGVLGPQKGEDDRMEDRHGIVVNVDISNSMLFESISRRQTKGLKHVLNWKCWCFSFKIRAFH